MKVVLRVFSYLRSYPGFAFGTLLCALFGTAAGLTYPKLTGWIIDDGISQGDLHRVGWMTGLLALAFLLRDGFNYLRIQLNNTFEQNVIFDLRTDLYRVMQRLPLNWFDRQSTGDLLTRVSDDVTNMERVLIDGIEQGSVAVLQMVVVGVIMFTIAPSLAAWTLVPIPFMVAGAIWYTTTAHQRYRIQRKAASAMNTLLLDNLQGIRQIRSYAREEEELSHFKSKADGVRQGSLIVMRAWAKYSPSMDFFASLGIVLVLFFGGREVMRNPGFKVGKLVEFLLYVRMFYDPIGRLHSLNQLLQSGRAAAERVFKILDTPEEPAPEDPLPLPRRREGGRHVSYNDVTFQYEENLPVLRGIRLEILPGQTVAFVGPTGAGKSSIVNLLSKLYLPSSGSISIDGVNIDQIDLRSLRSEIGVVSQESFLFNATVRENLLFGAPSATEAQIWTALDHAKARDFVERLPKQLDSHVGERGVKLSVGEKQRLSIARALLKNAPILILDEATASVDTATELLIQEALENLLAHRTSLIIAHRLSTIRNADIICVIERGRIVEQGNHAGLLAAQGLYARLCAAQSSHPHESLEEIFEEVLEDKPS